MTSVGVTLPSSEVEKRMNQEWQDNNDKIDNKRVKIDISSTEIKIKSSWKAEEGKV